MQRFSAMALLALMCSAFAVNTAMAVEAAPRFLLADTDSESNSDSESEIPNYYPDGSPAVVAAPGVPADEKGYAVMTCAICTPETSYEGSCSIFERKHSSCWVDSVCCANSSGDCCDVDPIPVVVSVLIGLIILVCMILLVRSCFAKKGSVEERQPINNNQRAGYNTVA